MDDQQKSDDVSRVGEHHVRYEGHGAHEGVHYLNHLHGIDPLAAKVFFDNARAHGKAHFVDRGGQKFALVYHDGGFHVEHH